MLRISKQSLISILLPTFAFCQFVPTDQTNLAYFDIFKKAFNGGNYAVIYQMLTDDIQKQLSLIDFCKILAGTKATAGPIEYWAYSTSSPAYPAVILGYQKNLAPGLLTWLYEESKLKSFVIQEYSKLSFVDFMKTNPQKASFTAIADGKTLIDFNGNRLQDLMSVFKITVAIEFSRQQSLGLINPELWVSIDDVNKYYAKGFDDQHQNFLDLWTKMGKIVDNKVQLIEIARGMIALSSNANTEYLQTYLTLESIINTVNTIGLRQTTANYLTSYMLVFLNTEGLSREEYISKIKSYTNEQVQALCNSIHDVLTAGGEEASALLNKVTELLDGEVLGIQAQYFTKSTSNSYATVLDQLNSGKLFDDKFYEVFYPLIGYVSMQNTALAKTYKHIGVKGGSSAYPNDPSCVLSIGYFYELNNPFPYRQTSFALFTENLDYEKEYVLLITQFNYFTALLGLNGHYLNAVVQYLDSHVDSQNIQ